MAGVCEGHPNSAVVFHPDIPLNMYEMGIILPWYPLKFVITSLGCLQYFSIITMSNRPV